MRNKTSLWKRSLAALLCFVMVLGMLPAFGMAPAAYAVEGDETSNETGNETDGSTGESTGQQTNITGNYITLPITIRDYAADGMLFEYNEVNRYNLDDGPDSYTKTDRLYSYTGAAYTAEYNPYFWDLNAAMDSDGVGQHVDADENGTIDDNDYDYTGLRLYTASYGAYSEYDATETSGTFWYCVILDASGNVLKVLDVEAAKEDVNTVVTNTEGAAYSVWAWRNSKNLPYYNLLAQITEENKHLYRFGFDVTTALDDYSGNGKVNLYLGRSFYQSVATWQHGSKGIYVYGGNGVVGWLGSLDSYDAWHCVIINASTNQVVEVIPNGTDKVAESANYLTANYKFVLAWSDGTNTECYDYIAAITDANKSEYQIVTQSCGIGGPALFVERTISVNEADTRGFGLLMTGDYDYLNNLSATTGITSSELVSNNPTTNTTDPNGIKVVNLWDEKGENYATQDVYGATIRTNLVAKELDEITGKPRYTKDTVAYLANYMQALMAIPEKDASGNYNTHHVMGAKLFDEDKEYVGPGSPLAVYDLADIFRMNVTGGLGDYDTAKVKFDSRGLLFAHQATTWYEAAYYLLHMLWNDSPVDERTGTEGQDGYGMPIERYNRIHLVQTTNANGDITYVFNAKYDGTTYDYWNGEIFNSHFGDYNTETRPYSPAYTKTGSPYTVSGTNILPAARFDPLGPSGAKVNQGYTMAASPDTYGDFAKNNAMNWAEYYDETNYHMSLEGHAQFVYTQGANQYFTFTGDDDVYLYINGVRVLDVGGAHSIAKVSIDLNDVAEKCEMVDGGTYRFDFFFIERHGTAANFGIETNIQLAEPSMNTTKTGYQGGVNTGYGGPVDPTKHVGYTFELQNNGSAHIYNLEFRDDTIGVYVGWDDVVLYPDDFNEEQKSLYDISHLYLIYWDENGNITEYLRPGDVTVDIIKDRLAAGLKPGARIGIFGFKYFIQPDQWIDTDGDGNTDTFINTVYTTANDSSTGNGNELHGVSDWKVVKMQVSYTPFRVYDWVNKDVSKNPETVCDWKSPADAGLPLGGVTVPKEDLIAYFEPHGIDVPDDAVIVLCTAAGYEDAFNLNKNVTLNPDGSLTYNSKTLGKDTIFFKVKWDINKNDNIPYDSEYRDLVFSYEVYTYGSVNNVYVLDYGLSVELAGPVFGFQNNDNLENNHNNREMAVYGATGMMGQVESKDADGNTILVWDDITTKDGTYGTFTWTAEDEDGNPNSLKYTPDAIINGTDTIYAKFRIMEKEAMEDGEEPSIYNSVEMVQKITTAPASVVYYEENFPGITYVNTLTEDNPDGNQWVHYETVDDEGNSLAGTEQSANQDSNYGSDPNYGAEPDEETDPDLVGGDKIGEWDEGTLVDPIEPEKEGNEWDGEVIGTTTLELDGDTSLDDIQNSVISYLEGYLGMSGQASNGSFNALEIKETDEVMYFDFVGTGFEILSRTTQDKYAVIMVFVDRIVKDDEGNVIETSRVANKPVICESKGGDLYQVPIISITDLDHAQYRVTIKAAAVAGAETKILYIDGIRIYGPLGNGDALNYYNPEEYRAEIFEVKSLIVDRGDNGLPTASYMSIGLAEDEDGNEYPYLAAGSTFIEYDGEDELLVREANSVNEYMTLGPNNEIYFEGFTATSVIMFYATPIEYIYVDEENPENNIPYPESARTIEIGAHRKVDSVNEADQYAVLVYGSTADAIYNAEGEQRDNEYYVYSGTEQYYTINVNNLVKDSSGRYLVMIGTNGNDWGEILALTNLKVAGYTLSLPGVVAAAEPATASELAKEPMIQTMMALYEMRRANAEEDVVQIPVNENMTINSASLKASSLTNGKSATLSVKASAEAQRIEIIAPDGSVVATTKCTRKVSGGTATFQVAWTVKGARGSVLDYTIRVYDAEERVSANTKTVTITIK